MLSPAAMLEHMEEKPAFDGKLFQSQAVAIWRGGRQDEALSWRVERQG